MILLKSYYLNQITNTDYVFIVSTIEGFTEKQFNCVECNKRYRKHPNKELMDEKLRKKMACTEIKGKARFQIDQVKYYTCPGNFYSFSVASLMEGYHNYKMGVLPYPGSFFEQPAKVIDIYKMIDALIEDHKRKVQEEHDQKLKRQQSRRR